MNSDKPNKIQQTILQIIVELEGVPLVKYESRIINSVLRLLKLYKYSYYIVTLLVVIVIKTPIMHFNYRLKLCQLYKIFSNIFTSLVTKINKKYFKQYIYGNLVLFNFCFVLSSSHFLYFKQISYLEVGYFLNIITVTTETHGPRSLSQLIVYNIV